MINGAIAAELFSKMTDRVRPLEPDNTNKFIGYKLLRGSKKSEIVFDAKTKTGLFVRLDREPPKIAGITNVDKILGKDVSTALERVFSGGIHRAAYKATIESEEALMKLLEHLESL